MIPYLARGEKDQDMSRNFAPRLRIGILPQHFQRPPVVDFDGIAPNGRPETV